MAVTYTTAAARAAARPRDRAAVDRWEIALIGVSAFAVLLVLTTFFRAAGERDAALVSGPTLNLNSLNDPAALEPVLGRVIAEAADRRLAEQAIFSYLVQANGGRRTLSDVGTLARVRIEAAAIDRTSAASEYRARLRSDRARASAARRAAPASIAALTPSQLAELEPLLVVRTRADVRGALLLSLALYVIAFQAVSLSWRIRRVAGDRVLLTIAHLLTAFGFAAMVSRPDPIRDAMLFPHYTWGIVAGLAAAALASCVNLRTAVVRHLTYVPLLAAFALSAALLTFGSGPGASHARVNLGPIQPIEAIRILLALFLAGYFARNWELLRAVRTDAIGSVAVPRWLHVPRPRYTLPLLTGVSCALVLFYLQRDLGPALMLSVVFLAAYGVARGRVGLVLAGALLLAAGFDIGYRLGISSTLAQRVAMWQSPWDNFVAGGNQVAHALWAMSTGSLFGTGAGLGDTRYLPAGHTDLVLASIGEEFGFAGLLLIAALYATFTARVLAIARRAATDYSFFLALLLGLFLVVPLLLMASGTMSVVPLTGVVTPFLSYGGSAMAANFAALGLLASIGSDRSPKADLSAFDAPVRWLGRGLAAVAVGLVAVAANVQLLQADTIVIRPQLGVQADGMRRFQDNPRVLDVVRRIPRGTIVDRNGLPLASDDREALQRASAAYARFGIDLRRACPDADERCYPLGGRAFHLLGDARTRINWSASNTSFVERDDEAALRGFDDHAAVVSVKEVDGSLGSALRRDYRDLVPLLRDRYDPDDPAVKAAMSTHRRLALTIDARLQVKVAEIVAAYARKSPAGHAAAVVIDPASGDLLASVSYPWPANPAAEPDGDEALDPDALLDRARYGLYPPGSTFKVVTAAAALCRDPHAASQTFTCSRLRDGRVGAKIAGYAKAVRDDERDRTAHGTIDMARALAVSCNAYFAQLAVRIGPQALLDASRSAGIPIARNDSLRRIRETLPQIGYGQADVLASPLRMARVMGAIASDGAIRDTRIVASTTAEAAQPFVPRSVAALLARDLRDVVLEGTGRSLRGVRVAIAGKTGTAEVTGKPSHSWFVGFAPYGAATHRVAVAVLVENAGYGGTAAAPAAGEIVEAAAALGLAR
jgi:cell division protein FtsW (lipid II flippase)